VTRPACILADEPTGNLDEENSERVFALLIDQARSRNAALVLVTHNLTLASRCDRVMRLHLGRLEAIAPHHAQSRHALA
jgi:lipoprotein-releasing system ATP-binding protein